ncbi:MAG: methanol--corrinoid methyltransferase, partial [Patescibacteria group bacterium]|nr:methanol--corrinoid methyltransferase [Patescibacteria group bacterium]
KSFEINGEAGADLLAIESIGGKSVHDKAIVEGDIAGILLSLGILGCNDMEFLWNNIVRVSDKYSCIPAGDSACGFANTAMVLADRSYIPKVLAAVVRAMSASRTLVAVESGALGPSKDCAYEGPMVKAISGTPISMEGKSSACAHFSHLGNVAATVCDLWSNESVQYVKLLAGYAPECFAEMLSYDCRLMNTARKKGNAKFLQSLFVESDIPHNPQAFIIAPETAFKIAESIVSEPAYFQRTYRAASAACTLLRDGFQKKVFNLEKGEIVWLDKIEKALESLDTEEKVVSATQQYKNLYDSREYGL